MSNPRVSETATLVRLLVEANIEFIVVGMSAAVFLGVPATTLDLDIVHRRTTDNIERLQGLLTKIGGFYRHDFANRKLAPTAEALAGRGLQNLMTDHGPLHVLCELDGLGYEELLSRSIVVADGAISVRVLDLPTLIEVKTRAGRPKDKIALPLLLATLDERLRRGTTERSTVSQNLRRRIRAAERFAHQPREIVRCIENRTLEVSPVVRYFP